MVIIICTSGKFQGILLHVGRTSSEKSAMNALGGYNPCQVNTKAAMVEPRQLEKDAWLSKKHSSLTHVWTLSDLHGEMETA